jgi:hypothetical protein
MLAAVKYKHNISHSLEVIFHRQHERTQYNVLREMAGWEEWKAETVFPAFVEWRRKKRANNKRNKWQCLIF